MRVTIVAAAALFAAPALAQAPAEHRSTIDVSGHGRVSVAPDTARLHYWVRGEGRTPDEATRAMAGLQKAVENGLKQFLGRQATITNSDLIVIEVRDRRCSDQSQPRLSEGECAVIGYLARSEGDVTTPAIDKAGTAVGVASRLGASDARLQGFELRDTGTVQRNAMSKAVVDAREQAQILAAAAGGRLGRVLDIRYGSYVAPMIVTGTRVSSLPPAPPPPPPPVEIDVNPRPQEITADVSVSFELLP
jgi:uncharacterized protein YggE